MMILSNKNKFIFVHIPKTAGTSISSDIRNKVGRDNLISGGKHTEWDYHSSILTFERRVPSFDEYYKFTFVRNPWSRLFSWYCMLAKNNNQTITGAKFRFWLMNSCHEMSSAFPEGCGSMCAQMTPQMDYIIDSNGNNRMDFIGRFENLLDDYQIIREKLGINNSSRFFLPHNRRNPKKKSFREAYDEDSKRFVERYHGADIEEFKYTFR